MPLPADPATTPTTSHHADGKPPGVSGSPAVPARDWNLLTGSDASYYTLPGPGRKSSTTIASKSSRSRATGLPLSWTRENPDSDGCG